MTGPGWIRVKTKGNFIIFGGCWTYKNYLRNFVRALKVLFIVTKIWTLFAKEPTKKLGKKFSGQLNLATIQPFRIKSDFIYHTLVP